VRQKWKATRTGDSIAGQVAGWRLARSHVLPPEQVASALMEAAARWGWRQHEFYLADPQDRDDQTTRARGTAEQVELATLECVDWFNHRRLDEACGDIPPAELENAYYRQNAILAEAGQTTT
jgi:transposase InsO family protein